MNNIPQKNVILGFKESNQLPYQEADVKYFNNQSINSINLNNTFQQLRDNDLYLENQLNYISSYTVGPKTFSEDSANGNFVDGQKYWSGIDSSGDLSILHKVNKKPEETLVQVNQTQNVNYIVRFSGKFFAGTDANILTSDDGIAWVQFMTGSSYAYFSDDEKVIIGNGNDVHIVEFNLGDDGNLSLKTKKINNAQFSGYPTAIKIDDYDNMFVGTSDGKIYQSKTKIGNYSSLIQTESNVFFDTTILNFSDGGRINDFEFRSYNSSFDETNYIVATLSNGLAESDYDKGFIKESFDNFDNFEGTINDIAKVGETVYIATSKGIYENKYSEPPKVAGETYALKSFGGMLYCLRKDGSNPAVYKLNGSELEQIFKIESPTTPTDLEVLQAKSEVIYFVSTTNGIWYSVEKSGSYTIKEIETADNFNTNEIGASQSGNKINVFASQVSSNVSCFTVYRLLRDGDSFVVSTDTGQIDGFDNIIEASNPFLHGVYSIKGAAAYVDGNALKYIDGGTIYTFSSPIKKITKIQDTIVGSGYIVLTKDRIHFVDAKGNVLVINLDRNHDAPAVDDILNIVFNGAYVFLITGAKIYICNYDESAGLYSTNTYSSGGSQFKDAVISGGMMYVLSGDVLNSVGAQLSSETKPMTVNYYNGAKTDVAEISRVDSIDYSGNYYIVAGGKNAYFLWNEDGDGVEAGEVRAVSVDIKQFGDDIINVQFGNDQIMVATSSTAKVYDILYNEDDKASSLRDAYQYDAPGANTIKYASFVNGELVVAASDGLYVSEPSVVVSSLTWAESKPVATPEDTLDWDYNFPMDDDGNVPLYGYATPDGLSLYFNQELSVTELYSGSIQSAKLLFNDQLYASVKKEDGTCEVMVFGLSAQYEAGYYTNYIKLSSDYPDVFQDICACELHGLFIGNDGVYIDDYADSSYTLTSNGSGQEHWKFPTAGRIKKVIDTSGTTVANVDYVWEDSNQITLIVLGISTSGNKLYRADIYLEKTQTSDDIVWKLTPSKIFSIQAIKNFAAQAGIRKIYIESKSYSVYTLYILNSSSELYKVEFDENTADELNLDSGALVMTNVRDIFKDVPNNQIYAITGDDKVVDIPSLQTFASGITSSVKIKGIGKQHGAGFAYSTTPRTINFIYPTDKKQFSKYNTSTAAKKIIQDDGVVYLLNNSNQLKCCKNYPYISVLKSSNYSSFSTNVITGAVDFDAIANKVYFNTSSSSNKLSVYAFNGDTFGNTGISYALTEPVSQIRYLGYQTAEVVQSESDIAVKFSSDGLKTLTQPKIFLNFTKKADNIDKVVQDEDFNTYALKETSSIIQITNDSTPTKVSSGASTLFPAANGFIYHYSDGKDYWFNESISCLGGSGFTGLMGYNGVIYATKTDGVYRVAYKKDLIIPAERIYRGTDNVVEISPQDGSLDANLVIQVDEESLPRQYRAMFYDSSRIVSTVNSGLKMTAVPGVQSNKNDFDRFIIIRNSNNASKIAYDGSIQFWVAKNGQQYENWSTEFTDDLDIDEGYQFGDTIWLVLKNLNDGAYNYKIWKFDGYDEHIRVFNWKKNQQDINLRKFAQLGENTYVIDSDDGIFYLRGNSFIRMSEPRISFRALMDTSLDFGSSSFYYAMADKLYKAQNFKKASLKSENIFINFNDSTNQINGFIPLNSYEFIFATKNGIWATRYQFTLKNDLTFFKEQDVNSIYASMLTGEIDKKVAEAMDDHVDVLHNPNSVITRINTDVEDVNFSTTPPDWTKFQSSDDNCSILVSNDIPVEIYFGNKDDYGISVITNNFLGSLKPDFNYVVKRYASGITEMTMLVDTTNTYYISHVYGAGYTSLEEDGFNRKNLERFGTDVATLVTKDSTVFNTYKTSISVLLDTNQYTIDKLLDSQIYGCSLPLKIYLDVDSEQYASSEEITAMYQSRAIPSRFRMGSPTDIFKQVELQKDELSAYRFVGECFGTDQQSIRIQFYDPNNVYDTNGFTILFHGNDGYYRTKDVTTYAQKFSMEDSKQLKRNLFESYFSEAKVKKVFVGWSLSSVNDNEAEWVEFQNMQQVDAVSIMAKRNERKNYYDAHNILPEIKPGTVVHLYAVWQTYQFSDTDTILELNVGQDKFSINKYDINPSTTLKDVVMVNFETL